MEGQGQGSLGAKLLETIARKGDVTFLVGPEDNQEEIKSSVLVLCTFSSVFDTQFNETWKSQKDVIKLPDIQPKMFRLFLKLLLTDNLDISHLASPELCMDDIIHLLYIANKYDVSSVQSICRSSIKSRLAVDNAVFSYEALQSMNEPELEKAAFDFITMKIVDFLMDKSFKDLSHKSLTAILECEDLSVWELALFKGVCGWAESQCTDINEEKSGTNIRKILGDLLFLIRFPLMSSRDFYKVVQPLGILTLEEIVDISSCKALRGDSSFVNKSRFSAKGRPNVSNEGLGLIKKPDMDSCYMFTPAEQMTIEYVQIISACPMRPYASSYVYGIYHYDLKLSISDGNGDILPMVTKTMEVGASFTLEKTFTLEPNRSYFIYYDLKRSGVTATATIAVIGSILSVLTY